MVISRSIRCAAIDNSVKNYLLTSPSSSNSLLACMAASIFLLAIMSQYYQSLHETLNDKHEQIHRLLIRQHGIKHSADNKF